jgi:DNA-binding MarR family transcriptional regulator
MPEVVRDHDFEDEQIVLGLLRSVDRDGAQSQRKLAAELGIALGLVNAYLKRCVTKGLVKISEVPARRYAYYLTPKGFTEKSRLTVEYLSFSFEFFRRARAECSDAFLSAKACGWHRVALLGVSDFAEIAMICAHETGTKIVAVIDPQATQKEFVGVAVASSADEISEPIECFVVTDFKTAHKTAQAAIERFGKDRVLIPNLLGVRIHENRKADK